ncbi:NACHT, LRR and PYD domains-containing protein 12-like isoform X1 [Ctenopharyngodon idella]|uniref:NACHT, LRR and PYD domains-containing protein 12-like isoform X1 n=2 Tax=Ctenopharyngodon idella TaxID=7959 RepID=UPI002230D6F5|nr:NACHT, LRR and PYD domains-containing protein 12-like isoform X1 [Ctenopharyngodon idella]XP_051736584.1 NACHT, LRR and PYD domains-containing protein 12-like isoform X1 [Ctenopharyngodon idella]XP_051736585.1 NACHT, LRR and PYD domains-containing protein 12-like isoform X1 [Ctenopharyngodon idella]
MSESSEIKDDVTSSHEDKDSGSCSPTEPQIFPESQSVEVHQQKRVASPVLSCVSMKSDASMDPPIKFQKEDQCFPADWLGSSANTHVSIQSNWSMDPPTNLHMADSVLKQPVEMHSQSSSKKQIAAILRQLQCNVITFVKKELRKINSVLDPDLTECTESQPEGEEDALEAKEATVKITLHILKCMKEQSLFDKLLQFHRIDACQQKLKSSLKNRSQCVFEGIAKQGNPALLEKIYTELYITEGGSGEVNNEHEVRQIETTSWKPETQESQIKCNDIFKVLPGQNKRIRTVLTKGVAGIGKTVSVQKFVLDWAEGEANQDVHFVFPLLFRELNLIGKEQYTLEQLVHLFFREIEEFKISNFEKYKVIFIFDGLDECRLPLDFKNNIRCSDVTVAAPVDVLLTNLIKGNLLPSALLWITSRPAATSQIPPECVDQVTEVQGFNDPQKAEYFRKRIPDQTLANKIITHIKSSRSLYIMCHIPVFCWISATVLERMLGDKESCQIPKSLTEMYTHFLIFQTLQMKDKYREQHHLDPHLSRDNILSLGKLAFQQLRKGFVIFYEEDLIECGIDVKDASLYSGLCTQIFREEFGLYQRKVYCFVHLSFQEYLAALFVHLHWFTTQKPSSDEFTIPFQDTDFGKLCMDSSLFDLHKSAVNQALESRNGHFDLFLRFLLGLSQERSETLFRHLSVQIGHVAHSSEDTVRYIKDKLGMGLSSERSINLFHCLNELNDHSLVKEVQTYLHFGRLSMEVLSNAQWSALVFVLLTSDEGLEIFDLRKFFKSDDCLFKLHPVIKVSRTAILSSCKLTKESCPALASVLESSPNVLRELDLSFNELEDRGVKSLCSGLRSPHCKLETLKLEFCGLRRDSCKALVAALESNPLHLKELDLSYNNIGNEAATWIVGVLPDCVLETLRLSSCGITKEACAFLTSALSSKPCQLKKLDLSDNRLWDLGVGLFPGLLANPNCNLEELRLERCNFTFKSCGLGLEHSRLTALDLSDNDVQDSGMKQLMNSLKNPSCKLQKLRLSCCRLTDKGFSSLASALRSNPTSLKELDLSKNFPGCSGIMQLFTVLGEKSCALEKMCLDSCKLTPDMCGLVARGLSQNISLKALDMSNNSLEDEGVRLFCLGLQDRSCALNTLKLSNCALTDSCCQYLASVLSCQSVSVELDLSRNTIGQQMEQFLGSISNINLLF